jgi:ABC-type lipoprotein release transport system permease subunit
MQAYADLPMDAVRAVRGVDGVGVVHELVGQRAWLSHDDRDAWVQLVGIRPQGDFGSPLRVLAGRARPRIGEIVIDAVVAHDLSVGLGDSVTVRSAAVRSAKLKVAGIAAGGNNVIGSYAFVSRATLALAGMLQPTHLFVVAVPGRDPSALRTALAAVPGVRVLTRQEFETRNLAFPRQVFRAVIGVIDTVVTLVAVAMIAVVLHAGSLERRIEYGLLAALGLPPRFRYGSVVLAALLCTGLGAILGGTLALTLARVVPTILPRFVSAMPPWLLLSVGAGALGAGLVPALQPVRDVAKADPAAAFRA